MTIQQQRQNAMKYAHRTMRVWLNCNPKATAEQAAAMWSRLLKMGWQNAKQAAKVAALPKVEYKKIELDADKVSEFYNRDSDGLRRAKLQD